MAIANALQLKAPPRATPALCHFNYDAMPSLMSPNLSIAVFFAADTLGLLCDVTLTFDLWFWPLTFDLEHLQRIVHDVMKLCTKLERNRTIRGGVIAISVFDLMTLNIALRVAVGSGIIFTKFDLRQLMRAWIVAFLMLIRYFTLWPWPLTRWPWKFVVHQALCD